MLAAAGSAIGLGNLWKFPFITWDNRGGAFVLVYLAAIVAVGLPIMIAEIMLGKTTQKSAVGAMREAIGPRWGIVGGLGVFTGFVILSYYTVVAGWTLRYFWKCLGWSLNGFPDAFEPGPHFGSFVVDGTTQVLLAGAFMALTVTVVVLGIGRGIERVTRALMPALFGILILLFGSAMTMQGAGEALGFIFRPDFAELEWGGVLEAVGHAFFTLSLGMGAMITYGSYLQKKESVVAAGGMVVALDTLIAMVATAIMFSVIFSSPGLSTQISKSTAGMLFMTMPALFYTAVPFGKLLAPLFYLLVGFAALTSTISLLEVVASYFIDQRGVKRRTAAIGCGAVIFAVAVLCALSNGAHAGLSSWPAIFHGPTGIKAGVFNTLDHLASNWLLPIGGLGLTLAAGWALSSKASRAELERNAPRWFSYGVWLFFIRFVAPIAVLTILVFVIAFGRDFS